MRIPTNVLHRCCLFYLSSLLILCRSLPISSLLNSLLKSILKFFSRKRALKDYLAMRFESMTFVSQDLLVCHLSHQTDRYHDTGDLPAPQDLSFDVGRTLITSVHCCQLWGTLDGHDLDPGFESRSPDKMPEKVTFLPLCNHLVNFSGNLSAMPFKCI